jgi:phosphatidylserine/phosphatidylglycerophosphate/cardiolipin synthase-like enzyme
MAAAAEFPASFVRPWTELLKAHQQEQDHDLPSYHVDAPECLITTSVPRALFVGTGHSIFTRALLPAILNAKQSVHFVTCYWADSPTLDAFRDSLVKLASSRVEDGNHTSPLRVTIGFSSSGLFQKLFHTGSRDGHVYPPKQWAKLGLPDQATLKRGGIELSVKSLFFTPVSVMHPKYLLVDGTRAWIPSCNVSWERWFEGCVEVEGDIVQQLTRFNDHVWRAPELRDSNGALELQQKTAPGSALKPGRGQSKRASLMTGGVEGSATQSLRFPETAPVPTIFLPSSHHRNPRFSFFPFLSQANPPMTPLNAALLTLISNAQRSIVMVTPNVTSWPVVEALLAALERGVDVQIRTSKAMMLIEQLVTAGTTTAWTLDRLIRKYKAFRRYSDDPEAQQTVGRLEVLYYHPLSGRLGEEDEPVLSHFKMTMVDEEYLVLGSGNMDRASWWTSQEIGVLFYVSCYEWKKLWEGVLDRRSEVLFRSEDHGAA